ncbi:MAG: GNAT family N-acetyltransferase [Myxococcales bacterium]|nr:GNAT family N-acetyltransferase [Myxococcales bacterium]
MTDESDSLDTTTGAATAADDLVVKVRRLHRRDLNRVWEFLKRVFRDVNRETVEYQRPRTKQRFLDVYEQPGIEQLLFEVEGPKGKSDIVGYAECAFQISGADNWMNERYFTRRDMRPMFVEELAVSPDYQGRGIGSFILEQLEHLARVRGCTHLVLEVAENNKRALHFYRARHFQRLDAAIFLAKKLSAESELLPARVLAGRPEEGEDPAALDAEVVAEEKIVVPVAPGEKPKKKAKKSDKEGKRGKDGKTAERDKEAKGAKSAKSGKTAKSDKPAKGGKKAKNGKPAV